MAEYEGKSVVITGGSTGIGFATAELLVRRGARVLITGRTAATVEAAAERLGGGTIGLASDVGSLADIDALADRARAEFGVLHGLFVNAGVAGFSDYRSVDEAAFDTLFDVNVKGAFFTMQRLAPMLESGSGIVLTTSTADVKGIPSLSVYSASKAAVRSLARTFARELLADGVRVNAVSPGPIDTGILEKSMSADAARGTLAEMASGNPMRRAGTSEEVAAAVAFLLFDATYTTGAEFTVDGGAAQL